MANYNRNPRIAEYGKKTRFGASADPYVMRSTGQKPWVFRNAARRLALARFDHKKITMKYIIKHFGDKPTAIELMVSVIFYKALSSDHRALNWFELKLDGPLPKAKASPQKAMTTISELILETINSNKA